MKKNIFNLLLILCLSVSCSSSDETNEPIDNELLTPATYQFNRNGNTSVSYSDEKNYILMGTELITALKDNSNTEVELSGMFNNTGNYFSTAELNSSGLILRNKTAASVDYYSSNGSESNAIRVELDNWITNQANDVFPNWSTDAVPGVAGQIREGIDGPYLYVNAKGLEYNRALNKALIGAIFTDQVLNNHLSSSVLDANNNRANNDNDIMLGSNNYTAMEHHWDQAFGYVYGQDNPLAPILNQDIFLNNYLQRVNSDEDFSGIAQEIYDAFKLGRAAIVAKNYEVRDEQAEIIRQNISKIIGVRSVFYLQQGRQSLGANFGKAFHDLSEGYGFIYSLQFTRKPGTMEPYFTKSEVDAMLSQLMAGNGFWDLTNNTLNSISNTIADRFDFTVVQAWN